MASTTHIPLGEYIFRRILSLGVRHIFGVPGDFNLNLLDHIDSVQGLDWVGTRNELNAAYAADGYARARGLPGVVITTFGVGELSAINGIGGAVAEWVPVIHIVGMTARAVQKARLMIHHTLGEGSDHGIFREISKPLCAASAFLDDDASFTSEVDRVIEASCRTKLPVYLYVPVDVPDIIVDASRLERPLEFEITNEGQEEEEDQAVDRIVALLKEAQRPAMLVDLLVQRFGLTEAVRELVERSSSAGFVTPLGKSSLDETSENFAGVYMGEVSTSAATKQSVAQCDVLLHVGRFPSDSNTGGFGHRLPPDCKIVHLHPHYVSVDGQRWDGLHFVPVVRKLLEHYKGREEERQEKWWKTDSSAAHPDIQPSGHLKQGSFWRFLNPHLRENDFIIAEVGSSQFATLDLSLPKGAGYYTQIYYSSIGFTVGACLGTLVARRETASPGRLVLFVGDGSLQMTVQEISTMIHQGFTPQIFVINNAGYTVERVIHGPSRHYNNIDSWNYQLMLQFFGASSEAKSCRAETFEDLSRVVTDEAFQKGDRIQVIECVLDKYDSPELLSNLVDGVMTRSGVQLENDDAKVGRERKRMDGTLTESGLQVGR